MPDSLLTVLRLLLLSLIWLFFVRVLFLLAAKPSAANAVVPSAPPARESSSSAAPASSGSKASLRVISAGALAHSEFTVGDEATIGRGQGCQVQLPDSMVSQLHARLFRSNKGLHVEDLGSTNGTFVNGSAVSAPVRLRKGDRLRVGPIEMEVLG